MPVPGSENVSLTPFFEMFVVVPRLPIESEPPRLLRFRYKPLARRMRFLNRKPICAGLIRTLNLIGNPL
jgi:hypothetical protein